MKRLDKSKPFGIVCGNHEASFTQEGLFFDQAGNQIEVTERREEEAKAPVPVPVDAATATEVAELREALTSAKQRVADLEAIVDELKAEQEKLQAAVAKLSQTVNDKDFPELPAAQGKK